ncbi:hypothetical protein A0H81_00047 [Grifola frondosa]|uniref:Uncharacterized protein n=1 Tax=Grifola frondosa TaxID=5627 RepID=A0A1C7MUU3_GRIFR|nr:hypothetical protein A0H81_00047 [Grifola frondosa]
MHPPHASLLTLLGHRSGLESHALGPSSTTRIIPVDERRNPWFFIEARGATEESTSFPTCLTSSFHGLSGHAEGL